MDPHLYLLHLLQTNPVRSEANPQLPQFRTIQVCSKDLRAVLWQAERVPCVLCQIIGDPREWTMSEQAVEERRGWASDIVWVVLYSILILLVMLLWVDVPA
jgi:hypothetical protein